MKIALDWQLSSFFGWGVYGMNMALEWAKDPSIEASGIIRSVDEIVIDRLRKKAIFPFVKRSLAPLRDDAILLHSLGNECDGYLTRPSRIGVIFFEQPLSPQAIERAKSYDILIAGSTWNEELLCSYGLTNVRTFIQGIDRSLFHPAPKRNLYPGRFLIFTGGKAEPRKGQDIVVKAFRIFARKHPEAMLVTAWNSPWPQLRNGMDLDLSEFADRVIDVGAVPNGQMATVYRECDVGLFPNRAEGGTNLVAMECIACGLPVILSLNTGHLDLVRLAPQSTYSVGVTGVINLDEILYFLEQAFDGPLSAGEHHLPGWDTTAAGLIQAVKDIS
jgi:glycosyltransferase involved in cell wall biosynthesis